MGKNQEVSRTRIKLFLFDGLKGTSHPSQLRPAQIPNELKPAQSDSIILATFRAHNATLWTQDEHFKDIEDVRYKDQKSRK